MTDEEIIAFGRAHGCIDDLCTFSDYDPDVGAVPCAPRVKAGIRALLKSAAPQSVEAVVYWPEFPPFPTWISANDLHSLQEWAQAVRRDAFAAGMQRAAQRRAEPVDDNDDELPGMWSHSDLIGGATDCVSSPTAPTDAEWQAENERLRVALRFYARGEHYNLDESEEFDTVSGEPENWLCSGLEDSATMIETGRVALSALQGVELSWLDGDKDCTPQPVEGEKALREHLSTRPAQAEEWMPIETAPKDGTRVALSKEGGPVWSDCAWKKMARVPDRWESFVGPVRFEPTHWRPLPAPPTKTKEPGHG